MLWLTFFVFTFGTLYKLLSILVLTIQKEPFIMSVFSFKYGMRSILSWMTPFKPVSMKKHPVLSSVIYVFHICLFIAPLFLMAHITLLDESWGLVWPSLSDSLIDYLTLIVLACCLFYFIRRLTQKEVNYLTSQSDYILLAIVALPFFTGLMAYHQWFAYGFFLNLHILSGEIMLMAIPFTRLSHMIISPLTRAYMGSEFGEIRHAKDW